MQTNANKAVCANTREGHMIRLSLRLVMQPLDPPGLPRRLAGALTCSGTLYGSNSRSLREGKGYEKPLNASIAVWGLNL